MTTNGSRALPISLALCVFGLLFVGASVTVRFHDQAKVDRVATDTHDTLCSFKFDLVRRADDIVSWRFDCLEDAGYPIDIAVLLAERADVDLHTACDLLIQGATVHQALAILT